MIEPYVSKIRTNLKKVEGQMRLVDKMLEEKRYCIDVAQQVNAAQGLLKQVNNLILESHLLSCGTEQLATKDNNKRLAFVKELIKSFNLTSK